MEVKTNNTHYKDCPSMTWTAKNWYKFIMKNARETLGQNGTKYYYPVNPFMENKERKKQLEAEVNERYDELVQPLLKDMPEHIAANLVKKVQHYEMQHFIKMVIFLLSIIGTCSGIMFWNYDIWEIDNLGNITLAFMIFSVLAVLLWYLMSKMIRDAIIRLCSASQNPSS